ncbi:unnamed protein product [Cyprideis torosa]|uniref:Peptidase M14 domain-containing protein n=1 Tax=Cyprideis torosa TaxID=163714 RepID=A0A7R8WCM3_9CRUS|nr:unnamed protein product [Cyprideis torosa]CAG0893548.1 unnamed protein product [Cyprideis torosa]
MWRSSAVLLLVFPLLLVSLGNCSDTTEKDVVIRVIPTNLIQLKYLQSLQLQHVEIESFLLEKSQEYEFVDLIDFGDSYEGRNLWDLRINKPNPNGSQKNVFWLDANIHAREWITSAVATWIINELLTNSDLNDVIEQWDIHINPILNPDGLQYTKTEDRLWRKTRSPNSESSCIGADANRNWDYSFGGPGSSDNPCSNYYHGSRAFSEPETAAASEYISNLTQQPDMYLALHSFSQFVLTPWGDSYEHPEDYEDLMNIALRGEAEIERVGGGYWESGIVSELLHMGSGGARDWAKGIQGIKYAFTFELRDRGEYGFLLPAEQIIPAAQETLAGILAMLNAYLAAS